MRIRYSKDDPRSGQVVDLEEGLARSKIAAGEAEEVTGKDAETDADRLAAKTGLGTQTGTSQDADVATGSTGDTGAAAAPAPTTAPAPAPATAKKSARR